MRVLRVRSGGEFDRLMASGELDVEPSDQRVDVIRPPGVEREGLLESQIGSCACVEVERENGRWLSDDSLEIHSVDERFGKGGELERCVVEAIDIIPDYERSAFQ